MSIYRSLYKGFCNGLRTAVFVLTVAVAVIGSAIVAQAQSIEADLSAEEIASLQFMVEEEKLARDVYLTLGDQWNLRVFQNISRAEQQHMDAVANLLTQYGLENPAEGGAIGSFTNPDLQVLYDQLAAEGSQSVAAALKVGAAIEEIDILDLAASMDQTDNPAIMQVYENLRRGSENHLRAFVSNLERRSGDEYALQYMNADAYDAIIAEAPTRGRNGRRGNGSR